MSKLQLIDRLVAQGKAVQGAADGLGSGGSDAVTYLNAEQKALYFEIVSDLASTVDTIQTLLGTITE